MPSRALDESYFGSGPPKSTGRELFNMHLLNEKLGPRQSVTGAECAQILGGVYRYC